MKIFDSHIHLDAFDPPELGLGDNTDHHAFVPGTSPDQTQKLIAALRPPVTTNGRGPQADGQDVPQRRVYVGAAVHPWYIPDPARPPEACPELTAQIHRLAANDAVCAVGETGLDHYKFDVTERPGVAAWFRWHVALAQQVDKPLVIHCVRAHADCIAILRELRLSRGGVIHAFSGSLEIAQQYTALGFRLGIGSAVTRPTAKRMRAAAAELPLEHLLIETDAPYLAALDRTGGQGRTSDIFAVCDAVAELRGMTSKALASATFDNAMTLFSRYAR